MFTVRWLVQDMSTLDRVTLTVLTAALAAAMLSLVANVERRVLGFSDRVDAIVIVALGLQVATSGLGGH